MTSIEDINPPSSLSSAQGRSVPRILLVEDDPAAQEVVAAMLSGRRYHLTISTCGEEALALVEHLQPDLILLDVMMPGMDGYEVCRRLRATPDLAEIPIVMLTALGDAPSRLAGIEAGADDFLSKPVDRVELRARVATILQLNRYRKLVSEKQRFARLTALLVHGVVLLETSGRIRFVNPAFTALVGGAAVGSVLEQSILDWVEPDGQEVLLAHIARLQTDGEAFRKLEVTMRRGDRTTFPAVLDGIAYTETNRLMLQLVVQDITERVRLDGERAEAARRKDEFLALLSHELRNPLAPIGSVLDALRLGAVVEDQLPRLYGILERQFKQLVRLVDDLLDVSRISQGDIRILKAPCDLSDILNQALETSEPLIRVGRHEVNVSLPVTPCLIDGDAVRLTQVFSNLLNNAAKYTAEGGRITVTIERCESRVQVSVRDTGMGIAEEDLPHVFEAFRRAGKVADDSPNPGGLGLGLCLVKRLVELHGGQVTAHSAGLGKGSRLTVELPLVDSGMNTADDDTTPSPPPLRGRWILVVDDNRDAADMLGLMLQRAGGTVKVAYDGPSALALFDTFTPDVVLLDLGMPGMDGYEVAQHLRVGAAGKRAQIIAVSGWGQRQDRCRTAAAGFDDHLVKPIRFDAVLGVLG